MFLKLIPINKTATIFLELPYETFRSLKENANSLICVKASSSWLAFHTNVKLHNCSN